MKKQFHLTAEGVEALEKEQKELMGNRGAIAERIATAREFGDLAENAEYTAARKEQEQNETRINEIENILSNVKIIKQPKDKSKIELGNTVELKGKQNKKFTIVGSVEANPLEGKISDESPIGQALLGKKLGEKVEIKTPAETSTYEIKAIS